MKSVLAKGSKIYDLIEGLDIKLKPIFPDNDSFDTHNATLFAMEQWATGSILNTSDYGYSNWTDYNSSYYLPMGFIAVPELNNFYEGYGDTAKLNLDIALELLSPNLLVNGQPNTVTLLNPSNYYTLWGLY